MDYQAWRNNILRQEALSGGKLVAERRAYNAAIRGGGRPAGGQDALRRFVDEKDGIVMVYANWCPASRKYKEYLETNCPDLPIMMYDVARHGDLVCDCEDFGPCDCVGSGRLGVALAEGVRYYPSIFFLCGERSMNFDVPRKAMEELKPDYEAFRDAQEKMR